MKGITTVMKKIGLVLIIALAMLALVACGNGNGAVPESPMEQEPTGNAPGNNEPSSPVGENEPDASVVDGPVAADSFFFMMGDVRIEMDQDIEYVITNVGEPLGRFEDESCAFDGMDIIFSYPGIQIYTYPAGAGNYIHTIGFFDDTSIYSVTAEGGLRLGSSIQDIIDAYGDDYSYETGLYRFTRGLTVLEFLVEDGMVKGITYRLLLDL
jgi:hypothetical protein